MSNKQVKEVQRLIRNEMRAINTMYPCEVKTLNGTRVEVKILVDDTSEFSFPDVLDVPIMYLKAGLSLINMPVAVGDKGLVFLSTKSMREFKSGQGTAYSQIFDIDSAVYFGGVFTDYDDTSGVSQTALSLSNEDAKVEIDGGNVIIKPTGETQINDATDNALLFNIFKALYDKLVLDINAELTKIAAAVPAYDATKALPIVSDITPAKDEDLKI